MRRSHLSASGCFVLGQHHAAGQQLHAVALKGKEIRIPHLHGKRILAVFLQNRGWIAEDLCNAFAIGAGIDISDVVPFRRTAGVVAGSRMNGAYGARIDDGPLRHGVGELAWVLHRIFKAGIVNRQKRLAPGCDGHSQR